mmetsp:Transcript_2830/g.10263  ORF Transcript_2830/g.10263 Transcript_2830/m.10263 type:complete len:255 (+) Transcript_2830:3433-4197(+)
MPCALVVSSQFFFASSRPSRFCCAATSCGLSLRFFSATTAEWFALRDWLILRRSSKSLRSRALIPFVCCSTLPASSSSLSSPAATAAASPPPPPPPPSAGTDSETAAACSVVVVVVVVSRSASNADEPIPPRIDGGKPRPPPPPLPPAPAIVSRRRRADASSGSSAPGKRVCRYASRSSCSFFFASTFSSRLGAAVAPSGSSSPQSITVTFLLVLPDLLPSASIFLITSKPSSTRPNTTCLPSSHSVFPVQMKN